MSKDFPKVEDLVKRYRIRAVPTLVIDGKIKIEGVPTFRLVCDDSTYKFLEENFRIS
ncbi:MAG: thioredoxin family protein [Candidatus Caldarchaeum sp.]